MQPVNEIERIHQVLLMDGFKRPQELPRQIASNIEAVRRTYPSAVHELWSGDDLRSFLRETFDAEVLSAFDILTPYSYKTDLARYCLLYALGGLYLDLAVRVENAWSIPVSCGAAAFQEIYPGVENWTCTQTSILWAKPLRREFEIAIRLILANCRSRYYGPHDHYPTAGPLLGHAFASAMAEKGQSFAADDQWVGQVRYVTPERQFQNVCYIAPDKTLVARRTKRNAGDLRELGLGNTNNYTTIWKSRRVYGESTRVWLATDEKIVAHNGARTAQGIAIKRGTEGRVCYGPFVDLEAGQYCLTLEMAPSVRSVNLTVDICENYGANVLHVFELRRYLEEGERAVRIDFRLDREASEVEFRLYARGDFEGAVTAFVLAQEEARNWNFDDKDIHVLDVKKTSTGISVPRGVVGRVSYGPYTPLRAGRYRLKIGFSPETTFERLRVEVCYNRGNEFAVTYDHESETNGRAEKAASVEFSFDLIWGVVDAEIRVEVFGDFAGEIRQFSLTPNDRLEIEQGTADRLLRVATPVRRHPLNEAASASKLLPHARSEPLSA